MVVHGYSTLLSELPLRGGTAERLVTPTGLRNDVLAMQLTELRAHVSERGEGSAALPGVLDHLRHVQWHYEIETDIADPAVYAAWARSAQALLVVGDKVLNPAGRVLIGDGAESASLPLHPQALARSERVRRDLATRDITVPAGAIPVRSTEEVLLRRPEQVAKRAVALVVSADFALSVLDGEPLDSEYMERIFPRSLAERTPTEFALFRDKGPAIAARLKWGYEAAAQLLAMCGAVELSFPRDFADQGQVWNASIGVEEPELLRTLALLPVAEVCDAWENARALQHSVTMARADGQRPPAELDPEIVRQRYAAMEWLTGDQAWDDVALDVPCYA
ncbi:MAG: DUF4272 domain-containing protein [Propionibacteriaceae bacterium]|nr:DUF4272 domain-containing protein [Propionibacteriaceae bacterium]